MADLTVLFITADELPEEWRRYHRGVLESATAGYPVITIGRKKGDVIDTHPKSYLNIYRQMLVGAKLASTPYVAIAEDDVLYPKHHFNFFRPDADTFAYNQNRWALFTWDPRMYSMRNRKSNCSLIAPRELMILALEERFGKWGDRWPDQFIGELGRERIERGLGVTPRKSVEVYSGVSIVQFNHASATEDRQQRRRKSFGPVKAYDIYRWGRSTDLATHFR